MQTYGMNKTTEFTKKQISVIYGKAKNGELKVEKWVIKELYDLADYYGYDDNKSVEEREQKIMNIINKMFNGENVQELINEYTEKNYNLMSKKNQQRAGRDYL